MRPWQAGRLLACCLAASAATAAPFEVHLLVDRSASMQQNDPQSLRLVAAEQLVDLARDGDAVAIWQFAEGAGPVLAPTTLRAAGDRAKVKAAIRKLDARGTGTDLTSGLDAVFRHLDADPQPGRARYVVLLTDGRLDVPGGTGAVAAARQRLLDQLVPKFQARSWPVFTVGLSAEADLPLLATIARETRQTVDGRERGFFEPARTARDLPGVLARMVAQMASWETVDTDPPKHVYRLDAGLDRHAVFVADQEAGTEVVLGLPDGREARQRNGLGWRFISTARYTVIQADQPPTGEYTVKFIGRAGHSTCFVDSDLGVAWQPWSRASYLPGEAVPVTLALRQPAGAALGEARAAAVLRLGGRTARRQLTDDGTRGDATAQDGQFAGYLNTPPEAGVYQVTGRLDGPTCSRLAPPTAVTVAGAPAPQLTATPRTARRGEAIALRATAAGAVDWARASVEVRGPRGVDRLALPAAGRAYAATQESGHYLFLLTMPYTTAAGRRDVLTVAEVSIGTPDVTVRGRVLAKHERRYELTAESALDYPETLVVSVVEQPPFGRVLLQADGAAPAASVRWPLPPGGAARLMVTAQVQPRFWAPRHETVRLALKPEKVAGVYLDPESLTWSLCPGGLVHRLQPRRLALVVAGAVLLLGGLAVNWYLDGSRLARLAVLAGLAAAVLGVALVVF